MDIVKFFFSNLYWRFNKENDLSDVTWTMCYTSETFKQLFLQFFFPYERFDRINSFVRELSKEDSRADFVIDNDGEIYVIECKIGDKNHHFEQYLEAYKIGKERLGYIVNYNHLYKDFEIRTWRQFHDFIEENKPENEDEKCLHEAYLEYLKNVCGIIKITKKMELNGAYSLYCFNQILKSIINRSTERFTLSYYNTDFKESYYGYKFRVESSLKKDLWLNVGLWFNFEKPVITTGVWKQDGLGESFSEEIENKKKHIENYARKNYRKDSSYYFEGTEKFYEEFECAINADAQKDILCKFVDEVIDFYVSLS